MLYSYWSLLNWPNHYYDTAVVKTEEAQYTLELELPRFKKNEVQVEVSDSVLTVKAERKDNKYSYSTTLSKDIDVKSITSKLEDGVLTINLPKSKKAANVRKVAVE
jgi:HSP20 family protein